MRALLVILGAAAALHAGAAFAGPYAPAAGQAGSTAVAADDPRILGWATGFENLVRGPMDISDAASPLASFGSGESALGASNARLSNGAPSTSTSSVVSLGDGGSITLSFAFPLRNGNGADFAIFENSFNDTFLELAFVEVSSDGVHFFRFPSVSLTQTGVQIDQADDLFGAVDPSDIDGLAGKYRVGYGTPFDLGLLSGRVGLNIDRVTHLRLVDVVGSILPEYARYDDDPAGAHIINDPWTTPFSSGGFDLDAVAVLHQSVPEPGSLLLLGAGLAGLAGMRRPRGGR